MSYRSTDKCMRFCLYHIVVYCSVTVLHLHVVFAVVPGVFVTVTANELTDLTRVINQVRNHPITLPRCSTWTTRRFI